MNKTFAKLVVMVLAYVLILVNIIFGVSGRFTLTDFQLLLVAMISVSVIPALGGVLYKWIEAENEPAEAQAELRKKRERIAIPAAIVFIVVLSVYDIIKYLL